MVGMVDSFANRDRPPPPITRERQDELPEIKIPPPPNGGVARAHVALPPRARHRVSAHELLLPRRSKRLYITKVLLFAVIGLGLGILIGVGFLFG